MVNQIEAFRRLAALRRLPVGWDYGAGGPISVQANRNAMLALFQLGQLGAESFDIAPGENDGAIIAAYRGQVSAEIHARTDGVYELVHEKGAEPAKFFRCTSIAELISVLEGLGWQSPRYYASCTRNAFFRGSIDMQAPHLGTLRVVASRSSVPTVWKVEGSALANISASSTERKPAEIRQSSGEYRSMPCLEAFA